MQRIIKDDLDYKYYMEHIVPKLTDVQKQNRLSFEIWVKNYTRTSLSRKMKKKLDSDGLYNQQNDRTWASDRE